MPVQLRPFRALCGAICLLCCLALSAQAEVAQQGNLRVTLAGHLAPQHLPRTGTAPISVSVNWKIETADQSPPPKLKTLRLEINRHGRFETAGLPICPYEKIQPASSARALANCRAALLGHGHFTADVAFAGQSSYQAQGRLLVFNGLLGGKPVLLGQIYSARPFATSFVIVFRVSSLARGAYGTALSAVLPPSMRSWGNLTSIEMTLARRYRFQRQRRSYLSSGCPAPAGVKVVSFPLARAAFGFDGGEALSSVVSDSCRAISAAGG